MGAGHNGQGDELGPSAPRASSAANFAHSASIFGSWQSMAICR